MSLIMPMDLRYMDQANAVELTQAHCTTILGHANNSQSEFSMLAWKVNM